VKAIAILSLTVLAALSLPAMPVHAADIAACTKQQLLGFTPNHNEAKAHRQFPLPFISYAFETKMDDWGFDLLVRVDESGQVACFQMNSVLSHDELPLNDQRRDFVAGLKDWRYTPFTRNGQAIPVIISESINERETPLHHLSLPDVPLDKVTVTLQRQPCYGSCPSYTVEVRDGRATYDGRGDVDVLGSHHYRVPRQNLAKLVESLRASDVWSLRDSYTAHVTDLPTYILTLNLGGQQHQLTDYWGQMAGMPSTVSDLEDEVDKAARSQMWIHLSQEALEVLKTERFPFTSKQGADLLARAVANEETHDDRAMLSLIELGAPIDSRPPFGMAGRRSALIEEALENRRAILIDPLIAKGALNADGKPDQHKIDAAFRASIAGGNLALVQRVWNISADRPHPSLKFDDVSDEEKPVHKRVPVTLLLSHTRDDRNPWEGLNVARWLIAQGCDMKASKADGTTLLHIATAAGDPEFVRYLLKQGFDPSTPGEYGLPALGSADTEDVAMILLEAGTKMSVMHDEGHEFYKYAEYNHWQRVVSWLNSHGQ
jgi:hypothetical protein